MNRSKYPEFDLVIKLYRNIVIFVEYLGTYVSYNNSTCDHF